MYSVEKSVICFGIDSTAKHKAVIVVGSCSSCTSSSKYHYRLWIYMYLENIFYYVANLNLYIKNGVSGLMT